MLFNLDSSQNMMWRSAVPKLQPKLLVLQEAEALPYMIGDWLTMLSAAPVFHERY